MAESMEKTTTPAAPPPSPQPNSSPRPMHQLLLLSPSSPSSSRALLRKSSRTRLSHDLALSSPPPSPLVEPTSRRRCKTKNVGSPSSRVGRRRRKVLDGDCKAEVEIEEEETRKSRRCRSSKEKGGAGSVKSATTRADDGNNHFDLDRFGQIMSDLIMWNDVAKSSLWFGFGCLSFLSSCFAKGINFSIFSFVSQLGLLVLGFSFISNSVCQRNNIQNKNEFKLTEEDILKVGRVILPTINFAISKARHLFSGEPNMTLKVVPFLLIGAEYGHLITLRRLWALGFFLSFSCPKLYMCYCLQINSRVEGLKRWAIETWGGCSQKKIVATSAATAFWHLTSIRTRIFAVFILMVILRYNRQHSHTAVQEEEAGEEQVAQSKVLVAGKEQVAQSKALVVVETLSVNQ